MKLVTAREADSPRLKEFFKRILLRGAIDMTVERPGSFFDHYRTQSNDFETYILENDDGSVAGTASLVFREGHVLGERQTWGYATDLRVEPTRKAIAQWAQAFLPALERARDERRCKFVFSALEMDNPAYNAMLRPTSHARRRLPRYLLTNRFRVIALHGRNPFGSASLNSIRLKVADENDVEALSKYLEARALERPLSYSHRPEDLRDISKRWPGLKLSDFRIAYDSKDNIRGCAALWNGREVQSMIPQTYHSFAHTVHQTLWLASLTGLVRGTAAPEKPMPVRFLTHLACDNGEVFHRLADEAFDRLGPKEILAYGHFKGNWRTLPPRSFIATSLPFGLYMILPPNAEAPPAWPSSIIQGLPPEFEIAWL